MSKDSTSIDLGNNSLDISQEKIDNFSLSKSLVNLLWSEPFYSRVLRSITKIETEDIPTAGVVAKSDDITLWWNRKFFASLSTPKVLGVLKHECLHIVFQHTTERRKDPHLIWNYATDLAINSVLQPGELPDACLRPGQSLPPLTDDAIKNMTVKAIQSYESLSDQIEKFPLNKTSEFYFNELLKEGHAENLDKESEGNYSLSFDDHDKWDELSEEEKEFVRQKIKEVLQGAVQESNEKGWGTVPNQTRVELQKLISREINWESILKRFSSYTHKADRNSSIRRLNKKYPGIHAGHTRDYKPTIAIYVDESGSMNEKALSKLYAELENLSKQTNFYLYKFDVEVDEKSGFLWKKGKRLKIERTLSGGTSFEAPTQHALKNKSLFDGYIIFTDGGSFKPSPSPGLKRAYMITPGDKLFFEKDSQDILIDMNNNKKN